MASVARLPRQGRKGGRSASTRNILPGIVTAIAHGPISAEVGLLVNERIVIDVLLSNVGLDALELRPGDRAVAMIKATLVTLLEIAPGLRLSERNLIGGTIIEILSGPVDSEVVLDIGDERTIAAIVTTRSLHEMEFAPGVQALACFKASHIMLAVED